MGPVLHPVGPLPPRAYWLRRLLLLLALILVVVLAWWLFGGLGNRTPSSAGSTSSGTTSPTTSASTPSATTSTSHSPTATPSTSTSKPSPTGTAATAVCAESAIKVIALTNAASYPAGQDPRFTVQVSNTGAVACKRDVGQVALELIVRSGSARTWSSDDCNPGGSHAVVTLRPGQTFATTVVWARTTSAPGCPSGKPQAAPGHYQLIARNLTLASAPTPFQLL